MVMWTNDQAKTFVKQVRDSVKDGGFYLRNFKVKVTIAIEYIVMGTGAMLSTAKMV